MESAIELQGLRKVYRGKIEALKGADLKIREGSCFGLLGPNGAGKSTLVKVLLSIVRPSGGSARLQGIDFRHPRARRGVGYLPEGLRFPQYLTGLGACRYFGRLAGIPRSQLEKESHALLELVGLKDWKKKKVTKYSKGMVQRLGLAHALLGSPRIVFLDEPTDGVDPMGRQEMRRVIREACRKGATFLINSHILSEVEMVCDEVAILHKGEVLQWGSLAEIKASVAAGQKGITARLRTGEIPADLWRALEQQGATPLPDASFQIPLEGEEEITRIIDELRRRQVPVYAVTPIQANLEDAFVSLITAQDSNAGGGNP